ncbi:MAG TPA: virulence protein RhuM/Fic/DOC family protein [Clostridiales bacterium]|nr:virulence protein RhuM/Fic/DOC family protein [Clostridiales bacterium]
MDKNEIVLFKDENLELHVPVTPEQDTVWLTQEQMSELFDTARSSIAYHIGNIFKEGEIDKNTSVEIFDRSTNTASRPPMYYNLDVIISVGYRVKSKRGIAFRKWANSILKNYIIKGYAVNHTRINQLNEVIRVMKRVENNLDTKQVLSVIEKYSQALDLLDAYDHQNMTRPKGNEAVYILTYEECIKVISTMKYGENSDLFGNEKDDSFRGSIGAIYQSFNGEDLYPSLEEKAANLLYFVTKNHSFIDGNKRIAATMFLHFLERNNALFINGEKSIDDYTLVALTILIAESRPDEKEMMVSVVMNCIKN